ncbi:640_t:CDS:2 [Diversispora eburnea]|uniref:640_t:CDS:1 n=1 Tax=Diversispora eburnea TaxID=1213867 RepID=A0A9N9BDB5_9GLOM|nr:640_t:CDS:2 [Diversispora eburnea]
MHSAISYLIPRKIKIYFEDRKTKKKLKKLDKELKRKWEEDYESRKLEIEAEMKFKKKLKM